MSNPDEAVGLKQDLIQEWQHDPDNPCRDNEYNIGTRRKTPQVNNKIDTWLSKEPTLRSSKAGRYYNRWTPAVSTRTYDDYPGVQVYNDDKFWGTGAGNP